MSKKAVKLSKTFFVDALSKAIEQGNKSIAKAEDDIELDQGLVRFAQPMLDEVEKSDKASGKMKEEGRIITAAQAKREERKKKALEKKRGDVLDLELLQEAGERGVYEYADTMDRKEKEKLAKQKKKSDLISAHIKMLYPENLKDVKITGDKKKSVKGAIMAGVLPFEALNETQTDGDKYVAAGVVYSFTKNEKGNFNVIVH